MQIKYAFKYFDFCLLLFLRENKSDYFKYWIKSYDKTFEFYYTYKILSINKYYKKNDFKEIMALIYYYIYFIISKSNKKNINNFKMKMNQFNEYKINTKEDIAYYNIKFNDFNANKNSNNYNKLAIFCEDKNDNKKLILQDIIDIREIIRNNNNNYKSILNKNVYFAPLKNIQTYLYSFEHKTNINSIINNDDEIISMDKCLKIVNEYTNSKNINDIPKYSWNIGYNDNNIMLLSEENNLIYSFNIKDQRNISSLVKTEFMLSKKFNNIGYKEREKNNKIIDFISDSFSSSSFLLAENGEAFCINAKNKYYWLKDALKSKKEFPLKIPFIPKLKIINIAANNNNCYIIDNNGNLYCYEGQKKYTNKKNNDIIIKNWRKISLPDNNKRFLQCAVGLDHLLCLVEDNDGKGKIYSKGGNYYNQCGLNLFSLIERRKRIFLEDFIQCAETEDIDFKSISANNNLSAALSVSGNLYLWGALTISKKFSLSLSSIVLIKNYNNSPMIVDKIELNKGKLFAFARVLENNNYIKKLFSLELRNKNYESPYTLKEIELRNLEDNSSRLVPMKVCIGENKSYVLCIDENKIIKEINENNKDNKIINDCEISIHNYIEHENAIEKIKEIYSSDYLNKFINLFNSFSEQNISQFVEAIEKIKANSKKKIFIENIEFNQLIEYLKGEKEMKDLLTFFTNNENNNELISFFNYLKIRISLIEQNIMKYTLTSVEPITINFLQKVISNNILYLNEKLKIENFHFLLLTKKKSNSEGLFRERNIIKIKVDRYKANSFYDKYNEGSEKKADIELTETIFGQVFHYCEKLDGSKFLLNKGDRLFNVNLIGENAIDVGGPYREIISNMCAELQSNYIDLFIKTPNNENNLGLLRDKYITNPNLNKDIHKNAYEFIGKLMILAISTGEALNLNLHPIFWKALLEREITFEDYEYVDYIFYHNIKELEEILKNKESNLINKYDLNFVIKNSNKKDIELKEKGEKIKVNLDNLEEYINLSKSKRINEIQNQIEFIKNSIYSVIDKNILQILNYEKLEEMVCGKNVLDIKDFKEHTIYQGYKGDEEIIKWFWEWFEKSKEETRFKYLKFVSGRTRLQKTGFGFEYEHKIIKVSNNNSFPKSSTCFFSLKLPNYNSQKIFIEKMNYAIENCSDISDH